MTFSLDINKEQLSAEKLEKLGAMRRQCCRRILLATTLASSGHPGGSLSTLDLLLVIYGFIDHKPDQPLWQDRDRIIMSIGHVSPGVYSVLSEYGYFPEKEFLTGFRRAGSGFPGHVEKIVPGVEWDTGNLGQGFSTGVGMAMALKMKGKKQRVIVFVGDGEMQKGQTVEAMRFASKYKLDNLTVIVDRNHLQICGSTDDVMPMNVCGLFETVGWEVDRLDDGHDYNQIFVSLKNALGNDPTGQGSPSVIVARTIMGKGISFMENIAKYHGSPLKEEQLDEALKELEVENDYRHWAELRKEPVSTATKLKAGRGDYPEIDIGTPITYGPGEKTDCRSAYGNALQSLAEANNIAGRPPKIAGLSCDLEGSVKMGGFRKHSPEAFLECGIQEHHVAVMAGALSRENIAPFFSTFGVFAVSEVYNQNRLNDINKTNIKVVATHLGLDVGEDGPTHQGIDYIGLLRNLFEFSIFMPADPNQADRIVRYVALRAGNDFVGMGRSKMNVVTAEDGSPFFGGDYRFVPGKSDWVRKGSDGTIITYGSLTPYVMEAHRLLKEQGFFVGVLVAASIKPFDRENLFKAAAVGPVLTVEDHHVDTGLGAIVGMIIAQERVDCRLYRLGVKQYGSSGKPADLYKEQGLDSEGIARSVKEMLA